jgi:hypothetical protein
MQFALLAASAIIRSWAAIDRSDREQVFSGSAPTTQQKHNKQKKNFFLFMLAQKQQLHRNEILIITSRKTKLI